MELSLKEDINDMSLSVLIKNNLDDKGIEGKLILSDYNIVIITTENIYEILYTDINYHALVSNTNCILVQLDSILVINSTTLFIELSIKQETKNLFNSIKERISSIKKDDSESSFSDYTASTNNLRTTNQLDSYYHNNNFHKLRKDSNSSKDEGISLNTPYNKNNNYVFKNTVENQIFSVIKNISNYS